jgi:HSP20 family protein
MARIRKARVEQLDSDYLQSNPRDMRLALDVTADDEAYNIEALIPGVEAEDLSVEVLDNKVSIQGEFKPNQNGEAQHLLEELPSGRFGRVIELPSKLDASKAKASLKNGVFSVRVPKSEEHRPKVIKIAAG